MKKLLLLVLFSSLWFSRAQGQESEMKNTEDPYIGLEDVLGVKSLEWVNSQNKVSDNYFSKLKHQKTVESQVREIVFAKDRIPIPNDYYGGFLYNFWQDQKNPKGLWRRTSLKSYAAKNPKWENLLDLDEMSKTAGTTIVFKGADCLKPYRLCLMHLSPGGSDSSEIREFDLSTKKFVENGFRLPAAKHNVTWIDENTILVGTDFGPGSMTDSGYSKILKVWKRGTPLTDAKTVFEGNQTDVSVSPMVQTRDGQIRVFIQQGLDFYSGNWFELKGEKEVAKLDFPKKADFYGSIRGAYWLFLKEDWSRGGKTFKSGSVIRVDEKTSAVDTVYVPGLRASVQSLAFTKDSVYLNELKNVKSSIYQIQEPSNGVFKMDRLNLPENGMAGFVAYSNEENIILTGFEDFLTPYSVYLQAGLKPKLLKQAKTRFNSKPFKVEQSFVKSKDGEMIPYFVISKKAKKENAATLLYGYGGFEISMTPSYLSTIGKVWLERGGVYVLANIRGGGEFGPAWHEAALKENRQKAYDDFLAIAEDLVALKITTPKKLGIMGGSNGGLLMGVMLTQKPEDFGAIVCAVPLLDMLRFHKLLAGASWMGEYGDPEIPAERNFIAKYSPYQNIKKGQKYPPTFFVTSTKDDRVHPGHARKMVARLLEYGYSPIYFENIEGGHGGAADLEQRVKLSSRQYSFLIEELMDQK